MVGLSTGAGLFSSWMPCVIDTIEPAVKMPNAAISDQTKLLRPYPNGCLTSFSRAPERSATIRKISFPASAQEWAAKVNGEHDFDMVVTGGSLTPELIISRPKYSSTGANNFGGHHNAEVDAAYERAGRAQTRSERAEAYRDLQRIWARDVEWVPLFWYGIYDLRSTRYFGYSDELGYSVPWWHWGRLRPTS